MDLGDIPAWLALVISVLSAAHQVKVNNQSERTRASSELAAQKLRQSDQQRQRIEHMHRDVDDIAALAHDYWMKPGSTSDSSGVLINSKIRDVSSRINRYGTFLWPSAGTDFLLFKQAVTGGQFQSSTRPAERATSAAVRNITGTAAVLKDRLRTELDKLDLPTSC